MKNLVRDVAIVSDGILVEFVAGECCYYPATFLLQHLLTESNHVFLNYDPCSGAQAQQLSSFSPLGDKLAARLQAVSQV